MAERRKGHWSLLRGFAIGGLVAFLATGLGVSALMARHVRHRAEAVAAFHAQFVTESVLRPLLTPADLAAPVTGARYDELRALAVNRILSDGRDVRVKIWRSDGTVLFSDYEAIVGRVFADERSELHEVFQGEVLSGVTDLSARENVGERSLANKLFQTYVPLRLQPDGPVLAAAEVYQDYSVIETDVHGLFRMLAVVFGTGLVILYLALLPIALRASRSLRRQNARLDEQAGELTASLDLLRRTDAERRQLLARLVAAQEEERQRIARDIHDDPIQKMAAAALRIGMLRQQLSDPTQTSMLSQVQESVDLTLARLRSLLFELHPRSLDSGGLADALREYLERVEPDSGVTYHVENRLTSELPTETRRIAYRIAQEALNNVRKHASAGRAKVVLQDHDGGVLVHIEDDGIGISAADLNGARPGHLGLSSMRERAEMAGGWLRIRGIPDGGTMVQFWLPGWLTGADSQAS